MNITNSYVNLLRYISANGKKSATEILPQTLKNAANLKYAGPAEYKSVPLGMPLQYKGYNYDWWKQIVLKKGGSESYALDGWFKIITPPEKVKLNRIEEEIIRGFSKDNIEKIEFFKTLSPKEREYLVEYGAKRRNDAEIRHLDSDDKLFFAVLSGHKPAWFCEHGFKRKIDFSKIKLNPKIGDKFDVVRMPRGELYFLNKDEVIKIITENKDIYCAELGVNTSANAETIYKALLENLQFGLAKDSLFGITLGFPRHSSMIFELESILDKEYGNLRENIPLFKEKLLELLHSDKSPFQRYPKETISKLEEHIKTMETTDGISTSILYCQAFGNEENAVEKIIKQAKSFDENFKIEDLM